MVNEIKMVEGNALQMTIIHEIDGKMYRPEPDEKYKVKICRDVFDDDAIIFYTTDGKICSKNSKLTEGEYCFEVSIVLDGLERVISPVTDKNGVIVNKLYVTKKLK